VVTATSPDSLGIITVDTASDSGYYARGATVTFTALTQQFYTFDQWQVNGVNFGNSNPISIKIDSPKQVTATYKVVWGNQPFAYRAYMTEIDYLQPLDSTQINGLHIDSLPNTLVITPGTYSYHGFIYNMNTEGLYRFITSQYSDQQERIVYKNNLDALLSGMSWIATPGTTDLGLSEPEKTIKAMTSKLSIYCSGVSTWAIWVLQGKAQCRELDINNSRVNHTAFEVFRTDYNKWCYYDLNFNASFTINNIPLSFGELLNCTQNGTNYNITFLSNDAGVDLSNETQFGPGQDVYATSEYYSELLTSPITVNGITDSTSTFSGIINSLYPSTN
jgi:Divergent InlB B-repeat domain